MDSVVSRVLMACGVISGFACMPIQAATVVTNPTELLEQLVKGQKSVALVFLQPNPNCGPGGCQIDYRDLSVLKDGKSLQQKGGKRIKLQPHALRTAVALPELDWTPLESFAVTTVGEDWGMCLEFTHTGVGKSGALQRWQTVVLAPRETDTAPLGPVAHRFVGYWASCSVLSAGAQLGEMRLPVIEPVDEQGRLSLVWYQCSWKGGCVPTVDRRSVVRLPGRVGGALAISDRP